jgi:hypothetical protein
MEDHIFTLGCKWKATQVIWSSRSIHSRGLNGNVEGSCIIDYWVTINMWYMPRRRDRWSAFSMTNNKKIKQELCQSRYGFFLLFETAAFNLFTIWSFLYLSNLFKSENSQPVSLGGQIEKGQSWWIKYFRIISI